MERITRTCYTGRMKLCRRCSETKHESEFRPDKRAKDGLCPHCSRTFKNLKNHMLSKHCGPKEAKRVADEMKRKKAKKKEAA